MELRLRGLNPEIGSLEESLAIGAYRRNGEAEFAKVMTVVNAILTAGNTVAAAVAGGESPGRDALKKSIDTLKQFLVPHWEEDTRQRADEVREKLVKEMTRGPLKIKVVGGDKKRGNGRRTVR